MKIDLNCDMGESFGVYRLGFDEEMMPHITSANIACGFHAGDPIVMERTISLAKNHGVSVGAHQACRDFSCLFGSRDERGRERLEGANSVAFYEECGRPRERPFSESRQPIAR